jgi:cardiolipin synthase C
MRVQSFVRRISSLHDKPGKLLACSVALCLFLLGLLLIGCASNTVRPSADEEPRQTSHAISAKQSSSLRQALAQIESPPGQSAVRLLPHAKSTLELLITMIQAAEHSLDLQYYVVEDDNTDQLLLRSLLQAADRGVRVRLLIDSFNFDNSNLTWSVLDTHNNIELRIFNPFMTNDQSMAGRMVNMVVGLPHYSRRMHNKVIIADNQLAVTGGRNLGDSYFDASDEINFHDTDILVYGPIVSQLSGSFDKYWNNDESFPLSQVLEHPHDPQAVNNLRHELDKRWKESDARKDLKLVPMAQQLRSGHLHFIPAKIELAVDSPAKLDVPPDEAHSKAASRLIDLASDAQREFIMVTPYLVPGDEGIEWLEALIKRGVKVRILTNSLASTDAIAAHAGYSDYRKKLLDIGAEVYEMKPTLERTERSRRYRSDAPDSLHSKVYMIDRKKVLVGSLNFDPRSIELNTEQLLVIHSTAFASQVARMFEQAISPDRSFHVVNTPDGSIIWETEEDGQSKTYRSEPKAGVLSKTKSFFLSILPLEDQL